MTHNTPPFRIFVGSSLIDHGRYIAIKLQVVGRVNLLRSAEPRAKRSFSSADVSLINTPNMATDLLFELKKETEAVS